jgi:glyoxylase-like metal-dependent hydrolase (beta-lactamase superfamily II)
VTIWVCETCGVEHAANDAPPDGICAICADDRQYVLPTGQSWLTLPQVQQNRNAEIVELEPNLHGIVVTPKIGIGHRSLLVQTPDGNVLFDPPGFLDDALLNDLKALGGVSAIATSHPHLTGLSVSFSHAFDGIPIWYGGDDKRWVRRPDPVIRFWQDQQEVLPGLTLVQCGGHFPGSAVLQWERGAEGRGAILTGDTIRVNSDRTTVSFMRSFPNLIPLPPRSIQRIADAVRPLAFDRIYGGFDGEVLQSGAHEAVRFSAKRYIDWVTDSTQDSDERR